MASTKTKMEIPAGDTEAPEQYQEPQDVPSQKGGAQDSSPQASKHLILAGVLALLTLTAILVGVLPDWKKDDEGKEETLTQSNSSVKGATFLELTDGPFNATLPLFSQSITEGYSSDEEFKDDLKELAKFFLNDAVNSNNGYNEAYGFPEDGLAMEAGDIVMADGDMAMADGDMAMESPQMSPTGGTDAASDAKESLEGVDAYETNNQEFTIDRADFVKSDGNLLFAAYQDYLIVFAAEGGDIIAEVQMTPLEVTGYGNGPVVEPFFPEPVPEPIVEEEPEPIAEEEEGVDGERPEPDVEEVTTTARSSVPWGWNPKPRIEAILIHENRLTLAVSGYGMEYIENLGRTPYLYEYLGTRIQVYDINGGDLRLLAETDVNGSFLNAYSNGQAAYIVTRSTINTWDHLLAPAQPYPGMDNVQYEEQVTRLVDEGLVEKFVDGLVDELQVNGPIDLARLSLFTDSIADDKSDSDLYSGLLAQAISQVVSLDMTSVSSSVQEIEPQITGAFHPGSWGQVYAMGSMIIVADVNWSWIREENRSAEKTFLICFRLDGAASTHSLVGSVNGSLLNPFSLDYVDKADGSYVRVATTQSFWNPWIGIMEEDVMVAVDMDEQAAQDVVLPPDDESSTLNQIIVLKVPSDLSGTLEVVGSVELGEPNEVRSCILVGPKLSIPIISQPLAIPFNASDSRASASLTTLRTLSLLKEPTPSTLSTCQQLNPGLWESSKFQVSLSIYIQLTVRKNSWSQLDRMQTRMALS